MRRISLAIAVLAVLTIGYVAFAGGQGELPECDGTFQGTLDSGPDAGFPTLEEAAAHALQVSFDVNSRDLVLEPSGGALYRVIELDGTPVAAPPTVSIERTESGYAAAGIVC